MCTQSIRSFGETERMHGVVYFKPEDFEMQTYSFRAECKHDVDCFLKALKEANYTVTSTVFPDKHMPDCVVSMTTNAPLEKQLEILKGIQDTHVIYETLDSKPISENKMDRTLRRRY